MKHKLISIASIIILLFVVLGSSIGCNPTANYTLTMASTAGGAVTPAIGAHTYDAGTVVNLTATVVAGYHFINWTGNVGTVANVTSYTTNVTMNGNYTITANFGLSGLKIIANVPDANQPPTQTLPATIPTNFCAPMAVANIMEYWDDVANNASAQNVTAGLIPETVAEYLGYFMDTNNVGSPARANPGFPGTYNVDILPGIVEFARWDNANLFLTPPPALPAGKLGYNWGVVSTCDTNQTATFNFYKNEIDNGRPLVVAFDFWNPISKGINYTDPETAETISVYVWGDQMGGSLPPNPSEYWTSDIGHAVTGVGYIKNWDPDGAGPIPSADWVIVHDNWATTPKNVAIPWNWWMCLWQVIP